MGQPARRGDARLVALAAAAALLIVAAALAVALTRDGDGRGADRPPLAGEAAVADLLDGIPQEGLVLGRSDAPVLVTELGDLQCAGCAAFTTGPLADVVRDQVRDGRVRLVFRHYSLIGPESARAARAALAASVQGRYWQYLELFFRNRPPVENAGLVDAAFLEAVARGAGVEDLERWREDLDDPRWARHLRGTARAAGRAEVEGVPAVLVSGPGRDTTFRRAPALAGLEAAIARARGA